MRTTTQTRARIVTTARAFRSSGVAQSALAVDSGWLAYLAGFFLVVRPSLVFCRFWCVLLRCSCFVSLWVAVLVLRL
eukprot:3537850-Alexandrium_andersonii.AAC.1